jgi:arabinogalactan oligomer/maltooligosaccharide transport system substrate-binding protein
MNDLDKLATDSKFAFKNDPTKTVAFLADWSNLYNSFGFFAGYGGYAFGKDGTDSSDIGFANEGSIKAAEYMKTWYEKWPQDMKGKNATTLMQDNFDKGLAGAIIDGPWNAATHQKALGDNLGIIALPKLANGDSMKPFNGGKEWVVSQYAVNTKLAQAWAKLTGDAEMQKAFYTNTKELPAVTSVIDEVKGTDPLAQAVSESLENSIAMPTITAMNSVWGPMGTVMTDIANNKGTPEEMLTKAVETIKQEIASADNS